MKNILYILVFLLLVGFVSADDLQVSSISTSSTPVAGESATIHTEVILRNANASVSTSVDIDYGNSFTKTYTMTLTPNLIYAIDEPITYTPAGDYVVSATIDPLNLTIDDNVGNNLLKKTITVTTPSTPIYSAQLTSLSLTATQGTTQSGTIVLRNNGTADLTSITISLSSFTSGPNTLSGVSVSPTSISTLSVDDVTNLNILANIPSNQATGTYTGTLTVSANGNDFTTSINVIVSAASVVSISLTPLTLEGIQGSAQSGTINITNKGTLTLSNIAISMSSLTSPNSTILSGVSIAPSTISTLTSGSTVNLNVLANIPSDQTPGTYSGTITATVDGQQYTTSIIVKVEYAVVTPSFTVNDLNFAPSDGSNGRGKTLLQTLHILNNGNQPLTLNLTSTLPAIYDTRISNSYVVLNVGASTDIDVTLTVPTYQVLGTTLLSGGIVITSSSIGLTKVSNVYITVPDFSKGMLEIDSLVLDNGGRTTSIDRNETYERLKPDTSIELTARVKNNYNTLKEMLIKDIRIDIDISGDEDVEETEYLDDLANGERDSFSVDFDVPSDAKDGDEYDVRIQVTGKDSDGVIYSDTYLATLEVSTPAHDISIKTYTLTPKVLVCEGRVTARITLENVGRYDETNVRLELRNTDLKLDKVFMSYTLDEDQTRTESFTFNVENGTIPGDYEITAITYYDNKESAEEFLSLHVDPCENTQTTTLNNMEQTSYVEYTTSTQSQAIPSVTGITGDVIYGDYNTNSFTDSIEYVILLAGGVVLLFSVLIILLVKFV